METITIKNMVCNRCIYVITKIFLKRNIILFSIKLGEVTLFKPISVADLEFVREELLKSGFEILDDENKKLIEKIKSIVISNIQQEDSFNSLKLSYLLSNNLSKTYSVLSTLFSSTEGRTIEHFAIHQRIEKAKELISYNEKNLNDISFELGYSSAAHFSKQFKQITGLTPSQFKNMKIRHRIPLDKV